MSEEMNEDRMQVKCNYDDGMMHIQGVTSTMCEGMNRKYGYAERMQCQKGVSDWLKMQTPTLKSGASGEMMYIPFEILRYENGVVQFMVRGDELNHPEGMVCDINPAKNDIKGLLAFARNANLITQVVGAEPHVGKGEEE